MAIDLTTRLKRYSKDAVQSPTGHKHREEPIEPSPNIKCHFAHVVYSGIHANFKICFCLESVHLRQSNFVPAG